MTISLATDPPVHPMLCMLCYLGRSGDKLTFSTVRQVDSAKHNYLDYLKVLKKFRPTQVNQLRAEGRENGQFTNYFPDGL